MCEIGGYPVVIGKNQFKNGDVVFYIREDAQLIGDIQRFQYLKFMHILVTKIQRTGKKTTGRFTRKMVLVSFLVSLVLSTLNFHVQ